MFKKQSVLNLARFMPNRTDEIGVQMAEQRHQQITRVLTIMEILDNASLGLTTADIHKKLSERDIAVTERTVYRDIELLRQIGFPILTEEIETENSTPTQKWRMNQNAKIGKFLILSPRELLALFFAKGALKPLEDTPFYADLKSTFQRIERAFGKDASKYFGELSAELKFEPHPRWGLGIDPDILETIRAACAERQILKGEYSSVNSNEKKVRELGPHYLYFAKGSMYLVAEDMAAKVIKVFSVPRFSKAELTDLPYEGEVVEPERFFEKSFGIYQSNTPVEIKVEFSKSISQFVKERKWHSSQQVICKEGGIVQINLHVGITPELIQWIMGFGAEAKVLSPPLLVDEISREAERLLKLYIPKLKVA